MKEYTMLINGQWTEGAKTDRFPTYNPANQEVWATLARAEEEDVNRAVDAAKTAFAKWSRTNGLARAALMMKLADLLDENAEKIGRLETNDNGKLLRESEKKMHFSARCYRYYAGYADKLYGEAIPVDNTNVLDYTIRQPIGVAALITAWNSPVGNLTNKLAPALATGCTVVIKPSRNTSVSTLEFGELIQKAGFEDGVVNIVTGDSRVGDYLTKNPKIGKISFTGGTDTGRTIAKHAAENLIPVTLELGGKSPNIVFEDADLDKAADGVIGGIFGSSGQTCVAGSRLLLQRSIYKQFLDKLADRAKNIRVGDPLDSASGMGPIANKEQYDYILSMIEIGVAEGAKVLTGGTPVSVQGLEKGLFIAPTILADVNNSMRIAREEVFGPVLCVIPFENETEALTIANDTEYGLASGIWSKDLSRIHRFTQYLEAGTVWVNMYRTSFAQAPFGGVKQSGYGRERGLQAMLPYMNVKNVMMNVQ